MFFVADKGVISDRHMDGRTGGRTDGRTSMCAQTSVPSPVLAFTNDSWNHELFWIVFELP